MKLVKTRMGPRESMRNHVMDFSDLIALLRNIFDNLRNETL